MVAKVCIGSLLSCLLSGFENLKPAAITPVAAYRHYRVKQRRVSVSLLALNSGFSAPVQD